MITFSYPINDAPVYSITLPNPDLNNADTFEGNIKVYRSRNNTVYTVAQHVRVGTQVEDSKCSFSAISLTLVKALRQFLLLTQGQYLLYTDHYNTRYVCLFLSPTLEYQSVGRNADCEDVYNVSVAMRKWIPA